MVRWLRAGHTEDFGDEDVFGAEIQGTLVAVYRVGSEFFATQDLCTHGQARLSEGFLDDGLIECPLHQGLFNVKTGAPEGPPCTEPLRIYETKIEDGEIYILWKDA